MDGISSTCLIRIWPSVWFSKRAEVCAGREVTYLEKSCGSTCCKPCKVKVMEGRWCQRTQRTGVLLHCVLICRQWSLHVCMFIYFHDIWHHIICFTLTVTLLQNLFSCFALVFHPNDALIYYPTFYAIHSYSTYYEIIACIFLHNSASFFSAHFRLLLILISCCDTVFFSSFSLMD